MRAIIVVSVDLPTPESTVEVLQAMDPPRIPHFAGEVRVAIGPDSDQIIEWLDAEEES